MKKIKKLLQFIYKTASDIFFDSFFDCLIFLNSPFSSFKRFHILPSLTLFSSNFCLHFLIFNSSAFSRLSANRFVARSFTSCSSLSLNSLKIWSIFVRFRVFLLLARSQNSLDFLLDIVVALSACRDTSWTRCENCSWGRNCAFQMSCTPQETRVDRRTEICLCIELGVLEASSGFVFPDQ